MAVVAVRPSLRVLCLDGRPSADLLAVLAAGYLVMALQPGSGLASARRFRWTAARPTCWLRSIWSLTIV